MWRSTAGGADRGGKGRGSGGCSLQGTAGEAGHSPGPRAQGKGAVLRGSLAGGVSFSPSTKAGM